MLLYLIYTVYIYEMKSSSCFFLFLNITNNDEKNILSIKHAFSNKGNVDTFLHIRVHTWSEMIL